MKKKNNKNSKNGKVLTQGKGDKNRTKNYKSYWDAPYWKNKNDKNTQDNR